MTFFFWEAEIHDMYSKFWDNVRRLIRDKKDGQKWLAEKASVGRTFVNNGIARLSSPNVDSAYAIAKALDTTVEELVDVEDGWEYIRQLVADKGLLWKPPPRIADIVDVLNAVDDVTLDTVRTMVLPLREKREGGLSSLAAG